MSANYYIEDWAFLSDGTLRVELDCPERDRCYEATYDPVERVVEVVAHWSNDGRGCERQTSRLDRVEEREVERWIECSPQVARIVEEERQEIRAQRDW